MKYAFCLVLCCLVFGIGTFVFAENKPNMDQQLQVISRLASLGNDERMRLLEQLSKDRSDLQAELISQLNGANPNEVNISVAYLLGLNRMEQSVRHLSRLITLEVDVRNHSREPMWDRYPVVEALIRIGSPAIPEMIKNIETSDDQKVRELSAKVIRYIDGPEIAKFRLEKATEKQTDPGKKAKLKAAMEGVEVPSP